MKKGRELWVALSALAVAAPAAAAAPERAGVTGSVNPAVTGAPQGSDARVLFVGSDVFRNETIRTDASGVTHLLFMDQSSLTVGPNSEVTIDRFVYDPKTDAGELGLSATTGILRFVGGSLSKRGNVSIRTPVGTLGIRGGIALLRFGAPGAGLRAFLVYGDELSGKVPGDAETMQVREHEQGLKMGPNGAMSRTGPLDPAELDNWLALLRGPVATPPEVPQLPLPGNYRGWLQELAGFNIREDMRRQEEFDADVDNRDFDVLAS